MSGYITAESVQPGMTIQTRAHADRPSVTLTVAGGGWCDLDSFENEVEPAEPLQPTHVSLWEADPEHGEYVVLPVTQLVRVLS